MLCLLCYVSFLCSLLPPVFGKVLCNLVQISAIEIMLLFIIIIIIVIIIIITQLSVGC